MRVTNIRVYQETYDEICRQPDAPDNQKITVAMEQGDKEKIQMTAHGLDVEMLEPNANRNVIVDLPDGYDESDVCATLLCQAAHYGYTTREKKRRLVERSDPFVRMQHTLYLKSCAHYLPKHLRKSFRGRLTGEYWRAYSKREAKRNGTKKKRDYRIERRIAFLNRQGIRKLTVERFTATSADRPAAFADLSVWNVSREKRKVFSQTLLNDVYSAEYVLDEVFQSHTKSEEGRLSFDMEIKFLLLR